MILDVHGLTVSLQTEMDRWHVVLLVLLLTSETSHIMDAPCKNSWFLVRMFFPQKGFHSHVFGNCYCGTPIVRDDPKLPSISPGGASTSH